MINLLILFKFIHNSFHFSRFYLKNSIIFVFFIILIVNLISCNFLPEKNTPVVKNPVFNIEEGTYFDIINVRISCKTDDAKIIYTTDGTNPSKNNGSIYNGPVEIYKSTSLKAIAVKDLWEDSKIVQKNYIIIGDIIVKHGTQIIPDVTGEYNIIANSIGSDIETTFIIENISNTSIVIEDIDLDSASSYYSIVEPAILTIPAGMNIYFTVIFNPLEYGTTDAEITITSNDINSGMYVFNIIGIALEGSDNAEIDVSIEGYDIQSDSYTYDFGTVNIGQQKQSEIFIIHNSGTSYLQLPANPSIQILGIDADNFNIIQPQNTIIQPGGSESFVINFIPIKDSSISADIIIANNDSDEFLFTFKVMGIANDVTPPILSSNVITASKVTCHNVTLNWTPATDNISAQSKLSYLAYYSLSSSMNTVSDIESHGSAYGSYTENISSNNITGLDLSTDYYFNVIVMDEAENKSCYSMVNQKTRDKAYMVSDINPEGSSVPSDFIIFNGLLYFNADNGTNGRELWHYDSVSDSAGFIDIKTGTEGSNPSYPQEFNGKIYFNADGDSNGRELWSYNGINAPSLVYNINPGSGSR